MNRKVRYKEKHTLRARTSVEMRSTASVGCCIGRFRQKRSSPCATSTLAASHQKRRGLFVRFRGGPDGVLCCHVKLVARRHRPLDHGLDAGRIEFATVDVHVARLRQLGSNLAQR
jgi:hypothetical protein